MAKNCCREACKHRNFCIAPILVAFWFVMFLNLELSGNGLDVNLCFDGSREDSRLVTEVIKRVHAMSGVDCIVQCLLQDEACRSVNFRKNETCGEQQNCELLDTVNSEEPGECLTRDGNFDYYILLKPDRKRDNSTTQLTSLPKKGDDLTIQPTSTATSTLKNTDDSTIQPTSTVTTTLKRTDYSNIQPTSTATSTPKVAADSITKATTSAISIQKKTDWQSTTEPTTMTIFTPKTTNSTGKTAKTPKKTALPSDRPTTRLTTLEQPSASCEELLKRRNRSLTSGVYTLQNSITGENYKAFCHMAELPGCGKGGWTLVMKVNGSQDTFKSDSHLWTSTSDYNVENGLEGLTDKETKLASYWNTPFQKLCLGMKVKKNEQWIVIDQTASSLFSVISNGNLTPTNISLSKWKSLIQKSTLQKYRYKQGFNIPVGQKDGKILLVRIGLLACRRKNCTSCSSGVNCNTCECNLYQCNSCIGFGAAITGCCGALKKEACGSIHACRRETQNNIDAFGYILVQ